MQTRKKRSRNRSRSAGTGLLSKLLTVVIVAALVTFGITLFFRVETIQITGLERLDAQQVLDACGIEYGDSMLLINKSQIASRLKVQLPYIRQVRIRRQLPGTLRLELTEAAPVGVLVFDSGELWLLGQDGTLLEQVTSQQAEGYLLISGFQLAPTASEQTPTLTEEADTQRLSAALELISALEEQQTDPAVTSMDLADLYNIDLYCGERFRVRLGSLTELDYKLRYLQAAIGQLTDDQSGIIDLTFQTDGVARFIPW